MTVIHEAPTGAVDVPVDALASKKKGSIWERPAIYRYGFLAFILLLWEIVGPFINPIFFSYPSKIATAAYYMTISGELPYYTWQSLQVMFYGLGFALLVGIPLALALCVFSVGADDGIRSVFREGPIAGNDLILRLFASIDWTQLVGGLIVAALFVFLASEYRRRYIAT